MKQKSGFSGQLGFVFAAAGSAVGVGNLWRFPYLAAKDGGGLFLIIYLVLVFTVGFTLLTTDIAIGQKTGKSAIYAYQEMKKKWKFLGILTFFVPVLIMTYYAVIGGWILKYITIYQTEPYRRRRGNKVCKAVTFHRFFSRTGQINSNVFQNPSADNGIISHDKYRYEES